MKRGKSASRIERDQPILARIYTIKADHPLWGYRRVWAYLRYREKVVVGKNRIYRIMKENRPLLVEKNTALLAKRGPLKPKPRADRPNEYWGTDMTKIKIWSFGWVGWPR